MLYLNAWVLSHFSHVLLCDPIDHSPPGSSAHGILQARIPHWVAMLSSRIFLIQGSNLYLLPWQAGSVDGSTTEPSSGKLLPGGSDSKESACSAGDPGSIPGLGRSPRGNGYPLQYSCLRNLMDRGAWWATVQGLQRVGGDWAVEPAHSCIIG